MNTLYVFHVWLSVVERVYPTKGQLPTMTRLSQLVSICWIWACWGFRSNDAQNIDLQHSKSVLVLNNFEIILHQSYQDGLFQTNVMLPTYKCSNICADVIFADFHTINTRHNSAHSYQENWRISFLPKYRFFIWIQQNLSMLSKSNTLHQEMKGIQKKFLKFLLILAYC